MHGGCLASKAPIAFIKFLQCGGKMRLMRFVFAGVIVVLLIIAGGVYYLYPTLYGIVPDSSNTPRLSDLANTAPSENSGSASSQRAEDIPAETIIVEGLDTPWAIGFLPSGDMMVTERKGTVRLVDKNGKLQENPIATLEKVKEAGEGGLLGMALHPEFVSNNFVYFYYTYNSTGDNTLNRIVRVKYSGGKFSEEQTIVDAIPGASNHNGGRIRFGPDNYLYITTGDAQEPSLAQDKNSLAGKILRVTDEGKLAPGNPFNNEVYSLGHRNPQGIAWDASGNLWETEHGPSGGSLGTGNDEVNFILAGSNYGWSVIQGDQTGSGMVTPVKNSTPSTSWAPGGTEIIGNNLFFSGLRGQALYTGKIEGNKITSFEELLKGKYGRIREVTKGPDGMLYISTSNRDGRGVPGSNDDRIIRINPEKL